MNGRRPPPRAVVIEARSLSSGEREEEELSDIERLFKGIGEGDRIKVYRMVEGKRLWAGSWPFDATIEGELDERLAREFGGGEYQLHGFRQGSSFKGGFATRWIDESLYPAKVRQQPPGAAPAQSATASEEYKRLAKKVDDLEAENRRLAAEKTGAREDALLAVVKIQENASTQTIAMIREMAQQRPAAAATTGELASLRSTMEVLKEFGFGAQGGGGGNENLSLGERVLVAPLTRLGEVVGAHLVSSMSPKPAPAATTAAQPAPEKPQPTTPVSMPQGARPMTDDEVKEMMRRRAQTMSNRGKLNAPAPKAKDATPGATPTPTTK